MNDRGEIVSYHNTLPTSSVDIERSPKRHQRRLAIYCAASRKASNGLSKGEIMVKRSMHKNVAHLKPSPLDIIFDTNGQTIGNQEGNLRFQRLISLYYIEKYQYAPTHIHRSLIRIEFLDELKSLGVRCFTTTRKTSLVSSDEDEQIPSLFSDGHRQVEKPTQLYSHLYDDHVLRRIRKAFIALSRRSKMATNKKSVSAVRS